VSSFLEGGGRGEGFIAQADKGRGILDEPAIEGGDSVKTFPGESIVEQVEPGVELDRPVVRMEATDAISTKDPEDGFDEDLGVEVGEDGFDKESVVGVVVLHKLLVVGSDKPKEIRMLKHGFVEGGDKGLSFLGEFFKEWGGEGRQRRSLTEKIVEGERGGNGHCASCVDWRNCSKAWREGM
jgi:hypothetical protein